MKTIEVKTTKPKLKITNDISPESPRSWSNIGHFIVSSSRYICPDNIPTIKGIVENTANVADNVDHHMELIKSAMKAIGDEVVYITPVAMYDHGSVMYRRGIRNGWDWSNNGMYIVTKDTINELRINSDDIERIEEIIDAELRTYTAWANGNVYSFVLYNDAGDVEDSCGGIYDINDIKDYLPDEWADEDLNDYLTD